MTDPVSDFFEAMRAHGVHPVEPIGDKLASGKPFRFRAQGDKAGRRNGFAWLHLDNVPAGVFRHYRLGIRCVWRAGSDPRSLSPVERRAIMAEARRCEQRRKAETLAKQEAVSTVAYRLWRGAGKPDSAHGYLARKGLPPFGIRQYGDAVLVPMFDIGFRLWNVQRVYPDGRKLFLSGGRTHGLFWAHGVLWRDGTPSPGPLLIGEGYATMAAIHVATGHAVVAALSAGNLGFVAREMRTLFPSRSLIVAADDDCHLGENIGVNAAKKAAESIGGLLATPRPAGPDTRSAHSRTASADKPPSGTSASADAARPGHG